MTDGPDTTDTTDAPAADGAGRELLDEVRTASEGYAKAAQRFLELQGKRDAAIKAAGAAVKAGTVDFTFADVVRNTQNRHDRDGLSRAHAERIRDGKTKGGLPRTPST